MQPASERQILQIIKIILGFFFDFELVFLVLLQVEKF